MNDYETSDTRGVVVVGIDGSPGSAAALRWAAAEANLREIGLRVVHAWTFSYPPGAGYGVLSPSVDYVSGGRMSDMRRAAEGLLERAIAQLPPDTDSVAIDRQVVEGSAAEVLVGAATENDLLVVGSRGRGGFASLLLGSVSQQCAHHAPCPIVIVHAAKRPPAEARPDHAASDGIESAA
jgi:nucleotide-binding universal stress UspA family protein